MKQEMRKFLLGVSFVGLLGVAVLPVSAQAQTERLPGVVDQPDLEERDTTLPRRGIDKDLEEPLEKEPARAAVSGGDNVIASKLREVKITGNTVIEDAQLRSVVKPFMDKALTVSGLAELKYTIKKVFYDAGYIFVRVVTPPQNFADGTVDVQIYEAKVGDIKVDKNDALAQRILDAMTQSMEPGQVIREDDLETMISDINDLKGLRAKVRLAPGKALSTTDLNLSVVDADEDRNYISYDNYGSKLTGKNVGSIHVEHSNAFNWGERITIDARHTGEDELWSTSLGYEMPLGYQNYILKSRALYSENEIGGRLIALNATGETSMFDVGVYKNLLNTRNKRMTFGAGFQARNHESQIFDVVDTDDNMRKLYFDATFLWRRVADLFYLNSKVSKGVDVFGGSDQGQSNATRNLGDQETWLWSNTFLYQARPSFVPILQGGVFKANLRTQMTSNTTLSSDLFSIGGYGSIRGFNVAQESGEAGFTYSLEYSHPVPMPYVPEWLQFSAGPFLDGGAVYNRIDAVVQDGHFYSAGLGVEMLADLIPVGTTSVRFDWAHPLGNYEASDFGDNSFYLRVKQEFPGF